DGTIETLGYTPAMMAETMKEDLPEVEYATSVIHFDMGSVSVDNQHIKTKHIFADRNFFDVFSFNLLEGGAEKSFADKRDVLISYKLDLKLCGTTENIIGRSVEWEWWEEFNDSYIISGIFDAPPSNSSLRFDLIFTHTMWEDG